MFRILSRYLVPEANTGKIVQLQSLLEVLYVIYNENWNLREKNHRNMHKFQYGKLYFVLIPSLYKLAFSDNSGPLIR